MTPFLFLEGPSSDVHRSAHGCTSPIPQGIPHTWSADYVVTIQESPFVHYVINGNSNPTLDLTIGQPYSFDLTAFGDEHPFLINSNATNPWGSIFLPAASGNVVSFIPTALMPDIIFYHREVHYTSMVGTIQLHEPQECPGDLNDDGQVNSFDFALFASGFNSACTGCTADLDGNGTVNSFDFALFANVFGEAC